MTTPSRRLVNVTASACVIEGMFFPSLPGVWSRTDAGLPADARCVNKGYDWSRDQFWFTFESPQFPEVPAGAPIPYFDGMSLSCFCFENPVGDKAIEQLNELTRKQIVHAAWPGIAQKWGVDPQSGRVLPADPDAPLVVG